MQSLPWMGWMCLRTRVELRVISLSIKIITYWKDFSSLSPLIWAHWVFGFLCLKRNTSTRKHHHDSMKLNVEITLWSVCVYSCCSHKRRKDYCITWVDFSWYFKEKMSWCNTVGIRTAASWTQLIHDSVALLCKALTNSSGQWENAVV